MPRELAYATVRSFRPVIAGPWRAVVVLGVTQVLAWGAIFYPPVLTVPLIAAEHGWSMTFAMGGSRCSPAGWFRHASAFSSTAMADTA